MAAPGPSGARPSLRTGGVSHRGVRRGAGPLGAYPPPRGRAPATTVIGRLAARGDCASDRTGLPAPSHCRHRSRGPWRLQLLYTMSADRDRPAGGPGSESLPAPLTGAGPGDCSSLILLVAHSYQYATGRSWADFESAANWPRSPAAALMIKLRSHPPAGAAGPAGAIHHIRVGHGAGAAESEPVAASGPQCQRSGASD